MVDIGFYVVIAVGGGSGGGNFPLLLSLSLYFTLVLLLSYTCSLFLLSYMRSPCLVNDCPLRLMDIYFYYEIRKDDK